jgi:hypothetical protein
VPVATTSLDKFASSTNDGGFVRNNSGRLTASNWDGGKGYGYGFLSMSTQNSGIDVDESNQVTSAGEGFVLRGGI